MYLLPLFQTEKCTPNSNFSNSYGSLQLSAKGASGKLGIGSQLLGRNLSTGMILPERATCLLKCHSLVETDWALTVCEKTDFTGHVIVTDDKLVNNKRYQHHTHSYWSGIKYINESVLC